MGHRVATRWLPTASKGRAGLRRTSRRGLPRRTRRDHSEFCAVTRDVRSRDGAAGSSQAAHRRGPRASRGAVHSRLRPQPPARASSTACPWRCRTGLVVGHPAAMPEFSPALRDLLARQDGVVTRAQLLDHEVSYSAVRWNAGRAWRVVLPQVYGVFRDQPTPRQRQVAALLWGGATSVLAGATAARLYGVTSADPRDRVHVLVSAPQRSRSSGFAEVRRTLIHDETFTRGPLRLCSPAAQSSMPRGSSRTPTAARPSSSRPSNEASPRSTTCTSGCCDCGRRGPSRAAARAACEQPPQARGRCPSPSCSTSWPRRRCCPPRGPTPCWSDPPASGSRHPTPGSTTSRSPSWCTRGATTGRGPVGRHRRQGRRPRGRRRRRRRSHSPPSAPATRGRAGPSRAGLHLGARASPSRGPGDPAASPAA